MRSHPPTVIFLDFYDVICLNNPYGGYDAKRALAQQESSQNQHNFDIWSKLFPDGHPKLPHLWPVKLLQAGQGGL